MSQHWTAALKLVNVATATERRSSPLAAHTSLSLITHVKLFPVDSCRNREIYTELVSTFRTLVIVFFYLSSSLGSCMHVFFLVGEKKIGHDRKVETFIGEGGRI